MLLCVLGASVSEPHTSEVNGGIFLICNIYVQALRQEGFKGVPGGSLKPPALASKILYTAQLYILSALPFVDGPLASLPLRITTHGASLRHPHLSYMDTIVCKYSFPNHHVYVPVSIILLCKCFVHLQ